MNAPRDADRPTIATQRRWLPGLLAGIAAAAITAAAVLAAPALRQAISGSPASKVGLGTTPASVAGSPSQQLPAALPAPATGAEAAEQQFASFTGDLQAGQRVVMGASSAGVQGNCFQCHGMQGDGDTGGAFPRLAGQPAWYLYKQLGDYGNGTRPNAIMTPIAMRLSAQERRDVAAYYAAAGGTPGRVGLASSADGETLQLGGALAAVGSATHGVQNCVGCHGPGGSGLPPDVPYLAGLSPRYLELQLQLWVDGWRRNDAQGVMADLARRLPAHERHAVSQYFGSLPPPVVAPPPAGPRGAMSAAPVMP